MAMFQIKSTFKKPLRKKTKLIATLVILNFSLAFSLLGNLKSVEWYDDAHEAEWRAMAHPLCCQVLMGRIKPRTIISVERQKGNQSNATRHVTNCNRGQCAAPSVTRADCTQDP